MNVDSVGPFSAASQAQTAMLATLVGAQQASGTTAQLAQEVSAEYGQGGGAPAPGNFQTYA